MGSLVVWSGSMRKGTHRRMFWVESLESRELLSFNPVVAGGMTQWPVGYPYAWAAGRWGSSDSMFIENERLGFVTATAYNMNVLYPFAGQSDELMLSDARFQFKNDVESIGTLTVRNAQAAYTHAEALWSATITPNQWQQVHNDGFYVRNSNQGTDSTIVFQDVDVTSIETNQAILFDGGSARRIYFKNVSWNNIVTIKVLPGATINEVVFENCQGDVTFQMEGGSLGTLYVTDPIRTRVYCASASLPVTVGLPPDLSQPLSYLGAEPLSVDPYAPVVIEAENFDTHGEGVSFHDSTWEFSSLYRTGATNGAGGWAAARRVDLAGGGSNGWHVTGIRSGEWLDYTIDVKTGGMYRVDTRLASAGGGAQMRIGFDGRYVRYGGAGGYYSLPDTGGAYATLSSDAIYLPAGSHVMHVQFSHTAGLTADVGEFDAITLVPVAAPTKAPPQVVNLRVGNAAGNNYGGSRSSLNFRWNEVLSADGYIIQRSADGVNNWKTIGQVAGNARDAAGAVTDYTDTDLRPDTLYYYRVAAYNMAGVSSWSAVAGFRTRTTPRTPAAPTNVRVRQANASRYDLSWTDASDNERSFKVERWNGSAFTPVVGASSGGRNASSTGVSSSVSYKYRVAAVNSQGQGYGPTIIVPANAGFESGLLANGWRVAAGTASVVYGGSGGSRSASLAAGSRIEQKLSNLTPQTTYTLRAFVRANAAGTMILGVQNYGGTTRTATSTSGSFVELAITFTTGSTNTSALLYASASGAAGNVDDFQIIELQPSAPQLAAPIVGSTSVTLKWTMSNTQNLAGFEIWRSADGRNYTNLNAPSRLSPGSVFQYTDATGALQAGTTFYYQVRAAQKGDEVANTGSYNRQPNFSNVVMAVVKHAPTVPTGLRVMAGGPWLMELTWNDNSGAGNIGQSDEHGFIIERAIGGGVFAEIARVGRNVTRFTDAGLPARADITTYRYRVRSFTSAAISAASNEAIQAPSLNAPANLTATVAGLTQVKLVWADRSGSESGFKIERSDDGGATFREITRVAANVTTYTDSGLRTGAAYTYRVRAYVTASPEYNSPFSNTVQVRTEARSPFSGRPITVPGRIEVEQFDYGGEGVAYHDTDPATNLGNARNVRLDPADIGVDLDTNGSAVWLRSWKQTEWLEYTVNFATAGQYRADFHVAYGGSTPVAFYLMLDGAILTREIAMPNTGGWTTFSTVSTWVNLPAGEHVIRLVAAGTNPGISIGNIDYMQFVG